MLKKIDKMHALYGKRPGKTCKDCDHIGHFVSGNRRYIKCACYGITCSEASDWRLKWQACGLIDKDEPERRAMEIRMEAKEAPEQAKGQIGMFEELED